MVANRTVTIETRTSGTMTLMVVTFTDCV